VPQARPVRLPAFIRHQRFSPLRVLSPAPGLDNDLALFG
jgi:hypothetical protein